MIKFLKKQIKIFALWLNGKYRKCLVSLNLVAKASDEADQAYFDHVISTTRNIETAMAAINMNFPPLLRRGLSRMEFHAVLFREDAPVILDVCTAAETLRFIESRAYILNFFTLENPEIDALVAQGLPLDLIYGATAHAFTRAVNRLYLEKETTTARAELFAFLLDHDDEATFREQEYLRRDPQRPLYGRLYNDHLQHLENAFFVFLESSPSDLNFSDVSASRAFFFNLALLPFLDTAIDESTSEDMHDLLASFVRDIRPFVIDACDHWTNEMREEHSAQYLRELEKIKKKHDVISNKKIMIFILTFIKF